MTSNPCKPRISPRTLLPRALNLLLWLVFCFLMGTGFLLAWRLPPGSRGGRGLEALGMGRHEWGDLHTWAAYAFVALVVLHLAVHWRWFWQVASQRRPGPLLLGIGAGLLLILALVFQPVHQRGHSRAGEHGNPTFKGGYLSQNPIMSLASCPHR